MSDFLAEAQVLIRPNTAGFAATLRAELEAITKTMAPVTVPVVAAVAPGSIAATKAATAAFAEEAGALQVVGAAEKRAESATVALARAQTAASVATKKLAVAQAEVIGASSAASAARIALTNSTAAVAASETALTRALIANDEALVVNTAGTLRLAQAQQAEALSALQAATAQRTHASSLHAVQQGAVSAAAAQVGLRGATLAASNPFIAGAAAAIVFGKAIQIAASTQQELNTFQAVVQATAEEMEQASKAARQLGADVSLQAVSAADAAAAMTELAKAGLDVQNSIDAARGTLLLAAAAQIDNAAATELTANALNAFGLAGEEASHVADLLAGASIEAQGSIEDMGLALKQSAAVARLAGLSIEDTVTFLTQLAQAGLSASDAGTSFRVGLLRLINPTKAASAALQSLGVQLRDAQGNVRADVFDQLAEGLAQIDRASRQRALVTIFGADASRVGAILTRVSDQFNETESAINRTGIAAEVAGARTKGFAGQTGALSSNLETLAGTLGGALLPALTDFVQLLNVGITGVNKFLLAFQDLNVVGVDVSETFREVILNINPVTQTFHRIELGIGLVKDAFRDEAQITAEAAKQSKLLFNETVNLDNVLRQLGEGARAAGAGIKEGLVDSLQQASKNLAGQTAGLQQQVLEAQIGGGEQAERAALARLRAVLERRRRTLEAIIRRGGAGAPTAQETLRETVLPQLNQVIEAIGSIDQAAVARAEAKAREAEQNARKIADARLAAQRAVIDALESKQQGRENRVIAAQATQGLADDIRANLALRASIIKRIDNLRDILAKTAAEAKQKAAAIANAVRDLANVNADIARLRVQAAQQAADAREARLAQRQQSLELDVEFAQTNENRSAEIKARRALIAFLEDQIKGVKRGSVLYKQLRNAIAEQKQAIKDLAEEQQQKNTAFKELSFAFLQAQQGFAANLLGNLIPGGATGGLVGGGSAQTQLSLPSQVSALPKPEVGIGVEAGIQGSRGGVTQIQFSVLIDLTRQMVRILAGTRADVQAPEARYNTSTGRAAMDSIPGHGGV